MTKFISVLILAAVAVGAGFLIFSGSSGQEEENAAPETEVQVRVGNISHTTLRGYVTAYGRVEPESAGARPAASARIASAVAGVVAQVKGIEGQHVNKGQLLVVLDSRAADVAAEFAEQTLERQKNLLQIDGTSLKAVQDAQMQFDTARVQQSLLHVVSPIAGTLTRVNVKPGEAVDLTTVLAEVVDLDRLVVSANVPGTELAALTLGTPVDVFRDSHSTHAVSGSLSFISPDLDSNTATALVRISLPLDSGLRSGQFVTVRIVSVEHQNILAVPVESVVKNEAGVTVIAVVDKDFATEIPVQTGLLDGGLIEIAAEGLLEGMQVVTTGAYGLPEKTRISVIDN